MLGIHLVFKSWLGNSILWSSSGRKQKREDANKGEHAGKGIEEHEGPGWPQELPSGWSLPAMATAYMWKPKDSQPWVSFIRIINPKFWGLLYIHFLRPRLSFGLKLTKWASTTSQWALEIYLSLSAPVSGITSKCHHTDFPSGFWEWGWVLMAWYSGHISIAIMKHSTESNLGEIEFCTLVHRCEKSRQELKVGTWR